MIPQTTSPLAEAIELMSHAAQAHIDGPWKFAQEAAVRFSQPTYNAEIAAADATGYGLRLAQAWWAGAFDFVNAVAVLSEPPHLAHTFEVPVTVAEAGTATITQRTWTWAHDVEPADVEVTLLPKSPLPTRVTKDTTILRFQVTPVVLEPSWVVDVQITPDSGAAPVTLSCFLDLTTEVP